ncbi:maleylacetate reductase [Subtercola boreus]|uniref:Maleylacetate reductase n=1 Tax=Subtercola boreus TaxID=120213 RepID=A0A3E0VDC9_9MICO|nr:maleylacetate reductase [Subtercola boreus]RFA07902.1 maleylacetate reductase [Subtercola boreus]TQL55240.1 maleylacetate reductase [Subtercola boreus]
MPLVFSHDTLAQRVLFGAGLAGTHLRDEISRLGARRVMLVCTAGQAERSGAALHGLDIALRWEDAPQHVPVERAEAARAAAAANDIDLIVAVGGGSTIGMAKAVALTTGLPIVAVPTTFAGSEATPVWGLTEHSRKQTGVDARVLPVSVIYDAALAEGLSRELAVASGLNGIAHCIDSLWAPRADPINATLAAEGITALARGLRLIGGSATRPEPDGGGDGDPDDRTALAGREAAQYGAYLSAVAFASAGSGLHHKICHVLGGTYGLPHAATHAIVLPYVTAFNVPAAPEAGRRIARAFGSDDALAGLNRLRADLDAPRALADLGFEESQIEEAATIILPAVPESNPRPVGLTDLVTLLRAARAGTPPENVRWENVA